MDNLTYIGIDIGKRTNTCSAPGKKVRSFANTKSGIQKMLKFCSVVAPEQELFFVMESTSVYSLFTAHTLVDLAKVRVAIVPPACVLGFINSKIKRTKNDNVDAVAIREFGKIMQPNPWSPPPVILQQLQQLRLVLDGLTKTITRQKALLEKLEFAPRKCKAALTAQKRLLADAKAERKKILAEIETLIQSDAELAADSKLILSIDGVGEGTRNMIMALCHTELKALSQRKLLAYCGMCPQENQSGKFKGQTRMNKGGDNRIREMLYMVAVSMTTKHGLMREYFIRHKEKRCKPGKVILVSIMRKVLYLIQAVVKSGVPFDRERYLNAA